MVRCRRGGFQPPRRRRGTAVIVVMVVVILLTYASYRFVDRASVENKAARTRAETAQLTACIDSGEELLRALLSKPPAERARLAGTYNNPSLFRGRTVSGDERSIQRGRFTVIAPRVEETAVVGLRFGLVDESTKLSLPALLEWDRRQPGAARRALEQLPNMEGTTADALLDWIDEDVIPREDGAEADDYATRVGRETTVQPTNAPPRTLEELLPVRGITRTLLLGRDQNMNFHVSGREWEEAVAGMDATEGTGMIDAGDALPWSYYLTPYSAERNLGFDGRRRVFLNDPDLRRLRNELLERFPDRWIHFVIAYRQFGPAPEGSEGLAVQDLPIDLTLPPQFTIASVYELIGTRVLLPKAGQQNARLLQSPLSDRPAEMRRYLLELVDQVTTIPRPILTGRVNVNRASRRVLLAVPGAEEELVENILEMRGRPDEPSPHSTFHEAWLLAEGLVTIGQMQALAPFITTRGDVFRGQVVGFFDRGTLSTRSEVVIDASDFPPRTISRRDLRRFGRGYSLDVLAGGRLSSREESVTDEALPQTMERWNDGMME